MYSIVTTYVKSSYVWSETDVSDLTLKELLEYQDVRVSLTSDEEDSIDRDFFFSVNTIVINKATSTLTLNEWVETIDDDDLTLTDAADGLSDANVVNFYSLYDVADNIRGDNYLYGEGVTIPEGLDEDISFTTPFDESDYRHVANLTDYALFTVAGCIYPATVRDSERIFISGGNSRLKHEREHNVDLIDFSSLGTITTQAITSDNIKVGERSADDIGRYQTRITVTLDSNIGDKIPLLVLGGHLHILDDSYKQVDVDKITVKVNHLTALRRCAKLPTYSRNWVSPANLSGYGFTVDSFDAEAYIIEDISFIVLLDAPDIAMLKEPLTATGIVGAYSHYRIPKGLIFYSDGRLVPYKVNEYNEFRAAISVPINHKKDDMFCATDVMTSTGYAENGYGKPVGLYDAYVVELYSFA